jgi:hypothetical protein
LRRKIKILISEILELELYRAPQYIQDFFESFPPKLIERVEMTKEIMKTNYNKSGIMIKMHEIRDRLSIEIMDMTFEQENEYVSKQLTTLKAKKAGLAN